MKSYTVSKNPVFSASVQVIEESDPVNAEVTNVPTKQLIENDLALKAIVEKKMDPEEGMGLSHNDFTDEYKEAVDGLNGLGFGQDAEGNWGYTAPGANEVVPFGGSEAGGAGMYYCECTTAADVQVKEVSCEGFELKKGVSVLVKFSQTNTALNPEMDIAGTGAQRIIYRGTDSAFDRNGGGYFIAGRIYMFTYDNKGYHCVSLPGEETVYAYRRIYGIRYIKSENIAEQNLNVGDLSVSFGGYASGDLAAAFGAGKAYGKWSFAVNQATASGMSAAAFNTGKASGSSSFAEGMGVASGRYSHAGGNLNSKAEADYSYAYGWGTVATDMHSRAIGHYNAAMAGGASDNNTSGTALCIGNGISDNALSNAFSVQFSGVVKSRSTITGSTTADYAEYFEWEDGNPQNEDRVGLFVTMNGEKVSIASPEDKYILGIVSGEPFVLGNGDCDTWNGMYLRDDFGRTIYERAPYCRLNTETLEQEPQFDGDGNPLYYGTRPVLNPDYNPCEPYVSRQDRPEWAPVGMLGVLAVRQDGTCRVNGYCTCGEGGKATACSCREGAYRVVKVVSEGIVKVVFR